MEINWYPGHMAKTKRLIAESLKLVDAVCVVLDARIPGSSRIPDLDGLKLRKPLLYVLSREDLADSSATRRWLEHYKNTGASAVAVNSKTGNGVELVIPAVRSLLADMLEARAEKGQSGRAIRMMVAGIPNVGKSSLINRLSGRKSAKTEDRPGVTRGKQWIEVDRGLLLLDMPGVLQPKLEDKRAALNLAFTGAIKDNVLDIETLAMSLCETLRDTAPDALSARCKWNSVPDGDGYGLLCAAAAGRGCLLRGGAPDTERMARLLLDEFRGGLMGRISLECP